MILDTIVGGSYCDCTYVEIAKKLEKISRNNKAWITKKSEIGRNTFTIQVTNNSAADEIRGEIEQIRTELRLVLKHVTWGAEKVNAVNYLTKPPLW